MSRRQQQILLAVMTVHNLLEQCNFEVRLVEIEFTLTRKALFSDYRVSYYNLTTIPVDLVLSLKCLNSKPVDFIMKNFL